MSTSPSAPLSAASPPQRPTRSKRPAANLFGAWLHPQFHFLDEDRGGIGESQSTRVATNGDLARANAARRTAPRAGFLAATAARPGSAASRCRSGLRRRFHSIFRDKNRRDIGKSQSRMDRTQDGTAAAHATGPPAWPRQTRRPPCRAIPTTHAGTTTEAWRCSEATCHRLRRAEM
jgi:hypothetical protein